MVSKAPHPRLFSSLVTIDAEFPLFTHTVTSVHAVLTNMDRNTPSMHLGTIAAVVKPSTISSPGFSLKIYTLTVLNPPENL
jgi:hypothetical protein